MQQTVAAPMPGRRWLTVTLDGEIIECPLHQGRFDLRNGRALCSPATVDLKTYATRTVSGEVQVRI